ncbi:MAG: hypothetical protein ACKO2Z_17255 [Sphaerospermopsis kisseleviana]
MQVNQIIATGLTITNIMLLFSSSAQAQNRKPSVECNAALQRTKKQIQKNRKVKVVYTSQENISQHYKHDKNYPKNRPISYGFALTSPATLSVLNSDKFLTRIAKDIIDNCSSISIVYFGEYQTDHFESYGLLENNDVGRFKCILESDPRARKKLDWGYVVCI